MKFFAAITDNDWFRYPAGREDPDEVNFWQPRGPRPGGGRKALPAAEALAAKMRLNAERYPVEKSRGKNLRHGEL